MQSLHSFLNTTPLDEVFSTMKRLQVAVKMTKEKDTYLFNYEDEAPRGHPIVDGCRGTIWKYDVNASSPKSKWTCIRSAMDRFFNVDETVEGMNTSVLADQPLGLQEKLDGTLALLYWNESKKVWTVGTRNTFDCTEIAVRGSLNMMKVFNVALTSASTTASTTASTSSSSAAVAAPVAPAAPAVLDPLTQLPDECKRYTFLFELCSPYNQVVVYHPQTSLTLLSVRDNVFPFPEADPKLFLSHFGSTKLPEKFDFPDVTACRDYIEKRFNNGNSFEGMVVVQGSTEVPRRLKLKSKSFVLLAHSPGGNLKAIPEEQIVSALLKGDNELAELLTYYPSWNNDAQKLKKLFEAFRQAVEKTQQALDQLENPSRADIAAVAKKSVCPNYFFALTSKKTKSLKEYLLSSEVPAVLKMIGYTN